METIQMPALPARSADQSLPRLLINTLKSKISVLEGELHFYDELLSCFLYSCKTEKHREVELLKGEVEVLYKLKLSVCKDGANSLMNRTKGGELPPDLYMDINRLQQYYNYLSDARQALKSKIQQRFSSFIPVRIW